MEDICLSKFVTKECELGSATDDILSNISCCNIPNEKLEKISKVLHEAEKNIKQYAVSGEITCKVSDCKFNARFKDIGPGIDNIGELFESNHDRITGFDVIQDNADDLNIASIVGVGTTIDIEILLK